MIALDTNVLLRWMLDDDTDQADRAGTLIAEYGTATQTLRIADLVLAEIIWTLARSYRFSRERLADTVQALLNEPAFAFADKERITNALMLYRASRADFGDCLIAVDNTAAGCEFTATFDAAAAESPQVRLV